MLNRGAGQGNWKLTIEYDGTDFHGWQRQEGQRTVQGVLESALERVLGVPVNLFGASRTDVGVHAMGQVASFTAHCPIPASRLPFVLNAALPDDVAVLQAECVEDGFNARFSARGKHYRYCIHTGPNPSALLRHRSFHVIPTLDIQAMRQAAAALCGTRDFSAFRDVGCQSEQPVKTLSRLDVTREGSLIWLDVEGDAFLYHMVRILAGTLVDVGMGRISADAIPGVLLSGNRRNAGQTAPPQGLYLARVFYDAARDTSLPDDVKP